MTNKEKDLINSAIAGTEASKNLYSILSGVDNPVINRIMSIPADKRSSAIYQLLDRDVSHCPIEQQEMFQGAIEILVGAAKKAMTPLTGPDFDDPAVNVF